MSDLISIALVLAGIWLGVLTLVVVLVVRQIGLLTVQLNGRSQLSQTQSTFSVDEDGPEIGMPAPDVVLAALNRFASPRACLLLVSATCVPCHKLVMELRNQPDLPPAIALVAGRSELADGLAALLPPNFLVLQDPDASALAHALQIQSTPFAVAIDDGYVAGKAYVRQATDFVALLTAQQQVQVAQIL